LVENLATILVGARAEILEVIQRESTSRAASR
jgi:hypothetical protein